MAVESVGATTGTDSLQRYIEQQKSLLAAEQSKNSSSSASTSMSKITADMNTFLKILTTQLQNQDPMNAMDTNEFTRELVQFSGIEQQINTNDKLDKLISFFKGNGITPLLSYVDKFVEAPSNGQIIVQNGEAAFSYKLSSTADQVKIVIKDSSGNTIATMNGPTSYGVNRVMWDGKNSVGSQVADGAYKIGIIATDSNGKTIVVSDINLVGRVTSLQTNSDGNVQLSLGKVNINADDIKAVYASKQI